MLLGSLLYQLPPFVIDHVQRNCFQRWQRTNRQERCCLEFSLSSSFRLKSNKFWWKLVFLALSVPPAVWMWTYRCSFNPSRWKRELRTEAEQRLGNDAFTKPPGAHRSERTYKGETMSCTATKTHYQSAPSTAKSQLITANLCGFYSHSLRQSFCRSAVAAVPSAALTQTDAASAHGTKKYSTWVLGEHVPAYTSLLTCDLFGVIF